MDKKYSSKKPALNLDSCRAAVLSYLDMSSLLSMQGILLSTEQLNAIVKAITCIEADVKKNYNSNHETALNLKSAFNAFFHVWQFNDSELYHYRLSSQHIGSLVNLLSVLGDNSIENESTDEFGYFFQAIKIFLRDYHYDHPGSKGGMTKSTGKTQSMDKITVELERPDKPRILSGYMDTFSFLSTGIYKSASYLSSLLWPTSPLPDNRPVEISGPPLKSVFHRQNDENLFTSTGELTEEAKARGILIIETLEPAVQSSGSSKSRETPFLIINHGTKKGQVTQDAQEQKNGVLNIVGNDLLIDNRNKNDYIINDGPGSLGDPDLLESFVHKETLKLITIKWPPAYNFIRRNWGAITGYGLDQTTNRVIKKLEWLDLHGVIPKKIAMIGYSRGGAENHYLANAIHKKFQERCKLNIFNIDPVPGGLDILNTDAYKLPSNVESAKYFLAEHEKRKLFQAIDKSWLKQESKATKVQFIGLPDTHYGVTMRNTASGQWVGSALSDFLLKHKVITANSSLYRALHVNDSNKTRIIDDLNKQRKLSPYIRFQSKRMANSAVTTWSDYFGLTRTIQGFKPIGVKADSGFNKNQNMSIPRNPKRHKTKRPVRMLRGKTSQLPLNQPMQLLIQYSAMMPQKAAATHLNHYNTTLVQPSSWFVANHVELKSPILSN